MSFGLKPLGFKPCTKLAEQLKEFAGIFDDVLPGALCGYVICPPMEMGYPETAGGLEASLPISTDMRGLKFRVSDLHLSLSQYCA